MKLTLWFDIELTAEQRLMVQSVWAALHGVNEAFSAETLPPDESDERFRLVITHEDASMLDVFGDAFHNAKWETDHGFYKAMQDALLALQLRERMRLMGLTRMVLRDGGGEEVYSRETE